MPIKMLAGKDYKTRRFLSYGKVEFAILGVVGLVLVNSVYHLVSASPDVVSTAQNTRTIASTRVGEQAESYETKCREMGEIFVTTASRIRITGPYCHSQRAEQALDGRSIASTQEPLALDASNLSSAYSATVFKDNVTQRFSTDFIPVLVGSNKIRVNFQYPASKTFQLDVNIERKERN